MPFYTYKNRRVFYEDQGSGECLLFVHEWNSSSLLFRRMNLKYLLKDLRVVCLDLPGYGNSENIDGLAFGDFTDLIGGLLGYLEIKRCSLMGFCLGATIVLDFYRKFPEQVKSLILVEPVLKFPKILIPLLVPGFGAAFLDYLARHHFVFSLFGSQLIGGGRKVSREVFTGIGGSDPGVSVQYLRLLFRESRRFNLRKLEVNLKENCICILGKNTNPLFRKNASLLLRSHEIRGTYILDKTRHFVLAEQPADTAGIVLAFLGNRGKK